MTNLLEKIKRGMQWLFNDQARFAAALILLMFLVVGVAMLSSEASAHPGGNSENEKNGCHTGQPDSAQPGWHCHPSSGGWDWGGAALILGLAVVVHIMAGDDSPWAIAPEDDKAIDWDFNATPDATRIEFSIPFDLK